MTDLVGKMLKGSRYALARLISRVENRSTDVLELMEEVYPSVRKIPTIGITGPPGAGKSTLVDRLIVHYRRQGEQVAVIAVDPSSPFTGGAILGDRIRMQAHAVDDGVFIRSLGSRGHFGGLTLSTSEVVRLFSAAGFDVVLIETVGVGQTELSVMEVAETVVVMLVPESGDTIQTLKAGLLEIADIFVVNKADREGAEKIQFELKSMLGLKVSGSRWSVPVLLTVAARNKGIDAVGEKIGEHQSFLSERGGAESLARMRECTFRDIVLEEVGGLVRAAVSAKSGPLRALVDDVRADRRNPYAAARELLQDERRLTRVLLAQALDEGTSRK